MFGVRPEGVLLLLQKTFISIVIESPITKGTIDFTVLEGDECAATGGSASRLTSSATDTESLLPTALSWTYWF